MRSRGGACDKHVKGGLTAAVSVIVAEVLGVLDRTPQVTLAAEDLHQTRRPVDIQNLGEVAAAQVGLDQKDTRASKRRRGLRQVARDRRLALAGDRGGDEHGPDVAIDAEVTQAGAQNAKALRGRPASDMSVTAARTGAPNASSRLSTSFSVRSKASRSRASATPRTTPTSRPSTPLRTVSGEEGEVGSIAG